MAGVRGTKSEVRPGVWRLRVYAGRRPNGTPIQITKTIITPEAAKGTAKPGDGTRLADRELAKMIAKVTKGEIATGTETVDQLLDLWLAHAESIGRSPTTLREYRRIAEKTVRPALGPIGPSPVIGLVHRASDRERALLPVEVGPSERAQLAPSGSGEPCQ